MCQPHFLSFTSPCSSLACWVFSDMSNSIPASALTVPFAWKSLPTYGHGGLLLYIYIYITFLITIMGSNWEKNWLICRVNRRECISQNGLSFCCSSNPPQVSMIQTQMFTSCQCCMYTVDWREVSHKGTQAEASTHIWGSADCPCKEGQWVLEDLRVTCSAQG